MILGLNELNNVRKRSGERQPLVSRLLTGFLSQQDNTLWSPGMIISDKNYRGFLFSVTGETSNFTDRFFSWINDWLNTWVSLRIMETIIMTRWNKFNTAQNLSVYSIYRPYTRYTSRIRWITNRRFHLSNICDDLWIPMNKIRILINSHSVCN